MELGSEFLNIFQTLENSWEHFFVTGRAGTGKSTLLQYFCSHTRKKIAVLAPTGLAALNVKGQTIHSFFGLPSRVFTKADFEKPHPQSRLFRALDALVIDEVSMVRADLMDGISRVLQKSRGDNRPFGGVQILCFGDLFQLPPVVASQEEAMFLHKYYDSPYFFSARAFRQADLEVLELREVYRQEERSFVRLLDGLRTGDMDMEDLEAINERYLPNFDLEDAFYLRLSARNREVNELNEAELEALEGEEFQYLAEVSGLVSEPLPTDSPLRLKVGAQVVFLKNDPKRRFANGSLGRISRLTPWEIFAELETGEEVEVEAMTWEFYRHQLNSTEGIEAQAIGHFKQYPLRLAWAMTIHKSQGKSFDRLIVDMGQGAFEFGQTYVALSRCRSFEGLVLQRPLLPKDVLVDERVKDFYFSRR